jgi:hypothetical protein
MNPKQLLGHIVVLLALLLGFQVVATGAAQASGPNDPTGLIAAATRYANEPLAAFLKEPHAYPFDWTTDGCSGPFPTSNARFRTACVRHDFGYRNFGQAFKLDASASRKAAIDSRFYSDMAGICTPFDTDCLDQARYYYDAVRVGGGSSFAITHGAPVYNDTIQSYTPVSFADVKRFCSSGCAVLKYYWGAEVYWVNPAKRTLHHLTTAEWQSLGSPHPTPAIALPGQWITKCGSAAALTIHAPVTGTPHQLTRDEWDATKDSPYRAGC